MYCPWCICLPYTIKISIYIYIHVLLIIVRERSCSVVECLTRDQRAAGSSLTSATVLCPWARHINPSSVLVQPRKTRPFITEILLMGRKESNQTKLKYLKGYKKLWSVCLTVIIHAPCQTCIWLIEFLLAIFVEGHLITISAKSISILTTGFRGVRCLMFHS